MNKKYTLALLNLVLAATLSACATTEEPAMAEQAAPEEAALGTRYPTEDRLQYMYKCVRAHEHQESATTPCGCKIDKIAEKMTYKEYINATTVNHLGKIAGDAGAAYRTEKARDLKKEFKTAEEYGEKSCFGK